MCPLKVQSLFPSGLLWSPKSKGCWPSKLNVPGAHLLGADPWAGKPDVELRPPCSLGRTFAIVVILLFEGCPPEGMGLIYITTLPFLPNSLWFLLYIFRYRRSFLVDSGLSHQ